MLEVLPLATKLAASAVLLETVNELLTDALPDTVIFAVEDDDPKSTLLPASLNNASPLAINIGLLLSVAIFIELPCKRLNLSIGCASLELKVASSLVGLLTVNPPFIFV